MAKILILNMENASTWGVYRQLWTVEEGDVVISPTLVNAKLLGYIGRTLGFDASTVSVLPASQRLNDEYDEYLDIGFAGLSGRLEALLSRSPSWEVVPCQYTLGVVELVEQAGLPLDDALRFAAQRGPELLNRKSHFRQLAIGAGVPIAEGTIVASAPSLAKALDRYLPKTGTVIVKRDNSMAGRGNITITKGAATPLPGSRETWQANGDLHATAAALWHELTDDRNHTLVVEAYHDATHCVWFEFLIDDQGEAAPRHSGTFRRRPAVDPAEKALVWVGLDLPAELPDSFAKAAESAATRIVDLCAQVGYRGYVNVDAIITPEDGILVNEVNARWGGGTVLDVVGRRLIGDQYADEHVLSSATDISPVPLADALQVLETCGLHYSREAREGIVIISSDAKVLECAVIADNRSRSREIEHQFRSAVEELQQ